MNSPRPPGNSTGDPRENVDEAREHPPEYTVTGATPVIQSRPHRRSTPSAQQLVEHSFALLKTSKVSPQQPWLTLKMYSYALSSDDMPIVLENKPINGLVELQLEKPDDIKEVAVTFKGIIISRDVNDKRTFYQQTAVVWERSMGDPHSQGEPSSSTTFKGKLAGHYVWPFSIDLPDRITLKEREMRDFKLANEERLPPNLQGLNDLPLIDYQLSVSVKRAHILKFNSSLNTSVTYVPEIPVPQLSEARENAYRRNAMCLPGPDQDQGGWYKATSTQIHGLIFKSRAVEVVYSLFIAMPMAYMRGGVIPLYLVLHSTDKQALDLLSNPQAVRIGLGGTHNVPARFSPELASHVGGKSGLCRVAWKAIEDAPIIYRQEHDDVGASTYEQTLYGEIMLPNRLTPTFSFGQFSMKYHVDVYAPHPTGFEPKVSGRLSRTDITISASSPNNTRMRNLLPPGEYPAIEMESVDETFSAFADAYHKTSNGAVYGNRGDSLGNI